MPCRRVLCLLFAIGTVAFCFCGASAQDDEDGIVIHDLGKPIVKRVTVHDVGPTDNETGVNVGNILNAHYFPGLEAYRKMDFGNAKGEFDYFIERPQYTRNNAKQKEYFATAHYLRGLIYLDHATGLGRLSRAKADFEACLRWDPGFHSAYLALARVWNSVGDEASARKVLEHLLSLDPEETIEQQAREMLSGSATHDGTSARATDPPEGAR